MALAVSLPTPALPSALPEQRMAIYGVRWKDYVILREALDILRAG